MIGDETFPFEYTIYLIHKTYFKSTIQTPLCCYALLETAHSNLSLECFALLNTLIFTLGIFGLNPFLPETLKKTHPSPQHTFSLNFTAGASQVLLSRARQ